MPRLPLDEPLSVKDSIAFVMYAPMIKTDTDIRNNGLVRRFCGRNKIDFHDYVVAVRHSEWPKMLDVMQKRHLLVT